MFESTMTQQDSVAPAMKFKLQHNVFTKWIFKCVLYDYSYLLQTDLHIKVLMVKPDEVNQQFGGSW